MPDPNLLFFFLVSKERKLIILSAFYFSYYTFSPITEASQSRQGKQVTERKQEILHISLIFKFESLLFSYSLLPCLWASRIKEHIQTSGSQTGPKSRVVDDAHSRSFLAIDKSLFIFLVILFSKTCITIAFFFH